METKRKRKLVPKPIWLLFGQKARSLAETIMHLIPTECNCNRLSTIKAQLCLHCCFHQGSEHDPSSYLFRPNDPPEYMKLLNRTFVFIPDNAPSLPPDSVAGSHWTQFQVLLETVQMISVKHPKSTNLIACGYESYDKFKDSIPNNAKLLNSAAWDLVLQRVGEMMMIYLLLETSIFVPIPYDHYQQAADPPVCDLIPPYPRSNSVQQGSKKRK